MISISDYGREIRGFNDFIEKNIFGGYSDGREKIHMVQTEWGSKEQD